MNFLSTLIHATKAKRKKSTHDELCSLVMSVACTVAVTIPIAFSAPLPVAEEHTDMAGRGHCPMGSLAT